MTYDDICRYIQFQALNTQFHETPEQRAIASHSLYEKSSSADGYVDIELSSKKKIDC